MSLIFKSAFLSLLSFSLTPSLTPALGQAAPAAQPQSVAPQPTAMNSPAVPAGPLKITFGE